MRKPKDLKFKCGRCFAKVEYIGPYANLNFVGHHKARDLEKAAKWLLRAARYLRNKK